MLYNIWVAMLVTGFLLLVLSIVLMFVFHIPDLLDELSGRKAKRQIKKLKELNGSTGALENISDNLNTDDIYSAISSGSLISEEIAQVETIQGINLNQESINEVKNSVVSQEVSGITSEDSTGIMDSNVSSNNNNSSEESTGYMDEVSTSYVEESDITNILSDVESYNSTKRVVEILEEQTSV